MVETEELAVAPQNEGAKVSGKALLEREAAPADKAATKKAVPSAAEVRRALRGSPIRRVVRIGLWLLVLGAAGYGAWWWFQREPPAREWQTAKVDRGDIRTTVTATGSLQPRRTILIGAEVSGRIATVEVEENALVTAGQVLARFDTETYEIRVAQAEASLEIAQASVTRAKATRDETQAAVKRLRSLSSRGAVAAQELEQAEAAQARAAADLVSTRAQVEQARAALDQARAELEKAVITSPIDGVVLQRSVEPGNTVSASLQAPELFLVAESLSQMELRVAVDEADVGQVAPGQKATFTVDAWPERRFEAQVEFVRLYPNADSTVVTYETVLSVDNADGLLRPGMTATATITTGGVDDVLRVSNVALRFTPPTDEGQPSAASALMPTARRPGAGGRGGAGGGRGRGGNSVWVLRDGEPVQIPLKLGTTDGRYTQVLEGELAEGDEVLVGVIDPGKEARGGARGGAGAGAGGGARGAAGAGGAPGGGR